MSRNRSESVAVAPAVAAPADPPEVIVPPEPTAPAPVAAPVAPAAPKINTARAIAAAEAAFAALPSDVVNVPWASPAHFGRFVELRAEFFAAISGK